LWRSIALLRNDFGTIPERLVISISSIQTCHVKTILHHSCNPVVALPSAFHRLAVCCNEAIIKITSNRFDEAG